MLYERKAAARTQRDIGVPIINGRCVRPQQIRATAVAHSMGKARRRANQAPYRSGAIGCAFRSALPRLHLP